MKTWLDPQVQEPAEQHLSFERHIVGFKHNSGLASQGLLPVFSDDLSFDPTIVRLALNALVMAVVVVIDKKDGEV